jgi:diguanylate cyclase (GGDEF)-like protein
MNIDVMIGILSLFQAAALWGAYPRRRWAAGAAAGASLIYWLVGFIVLRGAGMPLWTAAGVFCVGTCFYASYVVRRNSDEYDTLDETVVQRKEKQGQLQAQVVGLKHRIGQIETEQREVLALYSMIKGLSEALSWEDMRPKLEIAIRQYLGVESFSLYVSEEGQMRPIARRRLSSSVGAQWGTLERYLQEHRLPVRVPHVLQSPEQAVGVPIFENEKLAGYFFIRAPKGVDPASLLSKAETFVDEVGFAFRRVRLFQDVERHSLTDGLTGLYRRGALDRKLQEEIVRGRTFKTTFCMLLLDIDHFKSLNDRFGHPFGDQVLARVGKVLRESFYETDFVARYGGEEFAVLLPRAQIDGVRQKAEAIRRAIQAEIFEIAMEKVRVTVSIGISHFPRDGATADAVLRQADQALYYAQENGRNRSVDLSQMRDNS